MNSITSVMFALLLAACFFANSGAYAQTTYGVVFISGDVDEIGATYSFSVALTVGANTQTVPSGDLVSDCAKKVGGAKDTYITDDDQSTAIGGAPSDVSLFSGKKGSDSVGPCTFTPTFSLDTELTATCTGISMTIVFEVFTLTGGVPTTAPTWYVAAVSTYNLYFLQGTVPAADTAYTFEVTLKKKSDSAAMTEVVSSSKTSGCDNTVCFSDKKPLDEEPSGLSAATYNSGTACTGGFTIKTGTATSGAAFTIQCADPAMTLNLGVAFLCDDTIKLPATIFTACTPSVQTYALKVLGGTGKTAGAGYVITLPFTTSGAAETATTDSKTASSDLALCFNKDYTFTNAPSGFGTLTYKEGTSDAVTLTADKAFALDTALSATSSDKVSVNFQIVSTCAGTPKSTTTACTDPSSFSYGLHACSVVLLIVALVALL